MVVAVPRLVSTLPAITAENLGETREVLLELAGLAKAIDKHRVEVKAPFLTACKVIDNEAKKLLTVVDKGVTDVKRLMADYAMNVERQRLIAAADQARLEQVARLEAADTGQTPRIVTSVVIPDAAPVPTQIRQHAEVVDFALIPDKYKVFNAELALADLKSGSLVPGAKLVTERIVVAR